MVHHKLVGHSIQILLVVLDEKINVLKTSLALSYADGDLCFFLCKGVQS